MFLKLLHRLHVPSDAAYAMALASIFGSIAIWARRNEKNPANAERLGIFIGLWAPTFMIIGNALQIEEAGTPQLQEKADAMADLAKEAAQTVSASSSRLRASSAAIHTDNARGERGLSLTALLSRS